MVEETSRTQVEQNLIEVEEEKQLRGRNSVITK